MEIKKIKRPRLYETVLEQLTDMIDSGELRQNEALPPERDLAERFGISRGTLREAFRILENEGIIITRHGGGRYVNRRTIQYSIRRMKEAIETADQGEYLDYREVLETAAFERACSRATAEDIEELERVHHCYFDDSADNESGYYLAYFHSTLAKAAHNNILAEAIKYMEVIKYNFDMLKKRPVLEADVPAYKEVIMSEHQEIIDALKAQDVERGKTAIRKHLDRMAAQ